MIAVIQRYKLIFVAACLIAAAFIAWFIVSRQEAGKIPSRGVFVMGKVMK